MTSTRLQWRFQSDNLNIIIQNNSRAFARLLFLMFSGAEKREKRREKRIGCRRKRLFELRSTRNECFYNSGPQSGDNHIFTLNTSLCSVFSAPHLLKKAFEYLRAFLFKYSCCVWRLVIVRQIKHSDNALNRACLFVACTVNKPFYA